MSPLSDISMRAKFNLCLFNDALVITGPAFVYITSSFDILCTVSNNDKKEQIVKDAF